MNLGLGLDRGLALTAPRSVSSGGGGGGDVPAWVEALAAPSTDLPTDSCVFTDGHYWSNAIEQPVTDLFSADLDPTKITASGMAVFNGDGNIPKLAGDLFASVASLSGTYRIRVSPVSFPDAPGDAEHGTPNPVGGLLLANIDNSGSSGLDASFYALGSGVIGLECTNEEFGSFDQVADAVINTPLNFVFTLKANGDTVSSLNGAAPYTDVASGEGAAFPTIPPTGGILLGVKYFSVEPASYFQQLEGHVLEFTRWDEQPDADLPTLSAG